jgi:hypothetical protein
MKMSCREGWWFGLALWLLCRVVGLLLSGSLAFCEQIIITDDPGDRIDQSIMDDCGSPQSFENNSPVKSAKGGDVL